MSDGAAPPPVAGRGRRPPRAGGDDRELAILATAERLLEERTLGAISVDDLARGAGISRPTFYFYFPSKDAVLLTLLDRVAAEADATMGAVFDTPAAGPREAWQRALAAYHETFRRHRALTVAWAEARSTSEAVRTLWGEVFERWVQRCATAIEAERARGAAPAGPAARDLAIALTSMNERVIYGSLSGDGPAVADADVVPVLLRVWLAAVYGDEPH
ncbi:TetR/AcrR family transcriptional regulator [Blastococcus goldschmidtiae]|uniref:TetR/AcrR family transcriptional regulator n=1 Tax=Blastococcus goldschmidtiae TaxID=3075546 RepID=A0ABU2K596_9ACTN|nr:TetR/AcrR family transcriptional regulator [Blastococcus sp. DSM 46792]MDT0275342.1 TetR/AcrR family transcriptional regulator [Blastococcus sp. DSM 46792]